MIDFDMALDVIGMPLESGESVDLAFAPFYEWFFAGPGVKLPLLPEAWSKAEPVARGIISCLEQPVYGVGADLLAGSIRLIALVSRVLRDRHLADGQHTASPEFSRHAALLKARNLMEHRGWFDPGCVGRLAREVGMAESHFVREFHAAYGLPPKQYSQRVLMRRACALLRSTDIPIKDIAERLGYEEASIFSRAFTRSVGLSPAGYRRKIDA